MDPSGTIDLTEIRLKGSITDSSLQLSGKIFPTAKLSGKVTLGSTYKSYEGTTYTIVPTFSNQVLPTKDRLMENNLTVKSIPTSIVANASGGNTLIIGG